MEKLLELLREYSTLIEERTGEYGNPIREWNEEELTYPIENMRIKSKEYGFIERLVKNDKIDTILFANDLNKVVYLDDFNFRNDMGFFKIIYYQLLMFLSIQDNPIEYLCSILKEK